MGLFSSSKSSSTTTNLTENNVDSSNVGVSVGDGGGVASVNRINTSGADVAGNLSIAVTDGGAIAANRDIALAGLDNASATSAAALQQVSATTGKALDAVERSYRSDTREVLDTAIKYGALALALVVGVVIWKAAK